MFITSISFVGKTFSFRVLKGLCTFLFKINTIIDLFENPFGMFEYNDLVQHSVGAQLFIRPVNEIFLTILLLSSMRMIEKDFFFFGEFSNYLIVTKRYIYSITYYRKCIKLIILTNNNTTNNC